MRKNFIQFLRDNNALTEFKANLKKSKKNMLELLIRIYEENYAPCNYLVGAFVWRKTPEGFDFWCDLNHEWLYLIDK